jgi:hypothetical protein
MSRLGAFAPLVLLAALAPACRETAEGLKEDAARNEAAAREVGREVQAEAAHAAEQAAEKTSEALTGAAQQAEAAGRTLKVKTGLTASTEVDASRIDVDSDGPSRTVVLRGSVPTAAQRAAAETLAIANADGWAVRNELAVPSGAVPPAASGVGAIPPGGTAPAAATATTP